MALNRALGNLGGGQKSWMNLDRASITPSTASLPHATPTVIKRKRGRPPLVHTRSRPLLQQQPQRQLQAVASILATGLASPVTDRRDSHSSSNSTSPQLPNHLTLRPNHPPLSFLPSPSPSEDHNADHTPDNLNNIRGRPGTNVYIGDRLRAAAVHNAQSTTAPSPSISPSPVFPTIIQAPNPHPMQTPPALAQAPAPAPYFQVPSQPPAAMTEHQHTQQHLPPMRATHGSSAVAPFVNPSTVPASRQHRYRQQPYQQPHQQVSPRLSQQVPTNQIPTVAHIQPKPSVRTNLVQYRDAIEAFKTQNRHSQAFRDLPRLTVLQEALEVGDTDYLAMHQLYCLLDSQPQLLPQTLVNHPNIEFTRDMLRGMLDWNENLSPNGLRFFCTFPKPITEIAISDPHNYSKDLHRFGCMVDRCVGLGVLQRICDERKFPPLVLELLELGISSLVFQRVVFRACLRRMLGGAENQNRIQCETRCTEIFKQNQQDVDARSRRIPGDPPPHYDILERQHEEMQWGSKLSAVCAEYVARANGQRPLERGLAHQSPTHQSALTVPAEFGFQTNVIERFPPPVVRRGRGRPRIHAPDVQTVPRLPHVSPYSTVQPYSPSPNFTPLPIFPQPGFALPQQRVPNPGRFALHQAHLRSPVLKANAPERHLYQFIEQCLFDSPRRLPDDVENRVERWTFSISQDMFDLFPELVIPTNASPFLHVDASSHRMRIRSVKWPSTQLPDEHVWVTAESSWIPYSIYMVNGKPLELRKKLHYGKDMPVDITPFLKVGENTLEITVMGSNSDTSYRNYLLGFEVLRVTTHENIRNLVMHDNRLSSEEVLSAIRAKLSGFTDDDEILIVRNSLVISLIDPFSASKMCDIPVRSKACVHNDCFDLDTFLSTRERKGDCSVADKWKCPICNADARPQHLMLDGFLQKVRSELEERGLARTRTIVVEQDGTWSPKDEMPDDDRSTPDVSDRAVSAAPANVRPVTAPPIDVEIIDLSD
ncbi:hypothetical protein B0J11DRAFT_421367 [Dendryphion nanum]|uniref:SP-RING-type domain-containing protein n=1 Tax=Dendryphion nanum TaxID=256645 RepID=A0A9P9EJB8_9PLEO|nr:hypothetical protein B0J11DRAFT_421367 [Dendryphion nanum]